MNILFKTSIIASFLGGMLALFAPCCITFMLPAYFAYTFKQKKAILLMTFVFFLGVATILVPIGLGISFLSQLFKGYHTQVFYLGGILMLFLAFLSFSGKKFNPPFKTTSLLKKHDVLSVFGLGLFSGLASSCCAPVLAGVLTLTALSAGTFQALILSLVYVFGIVFPLFILAYFWDGFNFAESKLVRGMGKYTNVITGVVFLLIGIYILYLAAMEKITSVSPSQALFIAKMVLIQKKILTFTNYVPDWIFLLLILLVAVYFFVKGKKNS